MAAVGKDGAESFSDFARFNLVQATGVAPPLLVDVFETQKNVLHIAGRTEPGARLTVNGQPIEVRADGTFGEFIALPREGAQSVSLRVVGRGGEVSEQTRNVPGS